MVKINGLQWKPKCGCHGKARVGGGVEGFVGSPIGLLRLFLVKLTFSTEKLCNV